MLKNLAHGLSQAAVAQSKGKNATPAFYSGFLASGLSVGNKGFGEGKIGIASRTLIASAVGGTASSVAGGKFANGAVTGAFVHLFNAENGKKTLKKYFSRIGQKANSNYEKTMNVFDEYHISPSSISTTAIIYKANKDFNGLFIKEYYTMTDWYKMGFASRLLPRVIEPIVIGEFAFKGGVRLGSLGVAIYEEW